MKPINPKSAGLAALQIQPPQPPPRQSIPIGIRQAGVSTCCGAPTKLRIRQGKTIAVCQACCYPTITVVKITDASLVPAYGRRPVTSDGVLDLFYRGMDFSADGGAPYMSIRDCAPNANIQLRYGKQLQKSIHFSITKDKIKPLTK